MLGKWVECIIGLHCSLQCTDSRKNNPLHIEDCQGEGGRSGNVLHYTVSHLFFIVVHRIVYQSQARGWNRIIRLCCLARRYHALDYMERTA